jgi:hypothetical protein
MRWQPHSNPILRIAAMALGATSAYHLAAIVWRSVDPSSSPLRHSAFVLIDGALAVALWWRPLGLFWVFAALGLQQLHSHGSALLRAWQHEHRVDWASVLVLVALPLICALLYQSPRPKSR